MDGAETVILSVVTQTQKTNLFFSHFGWHPLIFKYMWLVGDFERVTWLLENTYKRTRTESKTLVTRIQVHAGF